LAVKNFVATSNQRKSWHTARILCFNINLNEILPFQQAEVGIPDLGVRCKKWFNCTSGVGKKSDSTQNIRLLATPQPWF